MLRRPRNEKLDAIAAELVCPQCRYSLQGLSGRIVVCPECGTASEIARMVMERWDHKIYEVPYYGMAVRPVVVALLGVPALALLVALTLSWGIGYAMICSAVGGLAILLLAWGLEMRPVAGTFGRREGLRLALTLHGVMFAYTLVPLSLLGIWLYVWPAWVGEPPITPWYVVVTPLFAVPLAVVARRFDRRVALRCVEQYLADPAPSQPVVVTALDMTCPGCQQNLTGQRGKMITCPTCGLQSALETVAKRRPGSDPEVQKLYSQAYHPFGGAALAVYIAIASFAEVYFLESDDQEAKRTSLVIVLLIGVALTASVWGMFKMVSLFGRRGVILGMVAMGSCLSFVLPILAGLSLIAAVVRGEFAPSVLSIAAVVGGLAWLILWAAERRGQRWLRREFEALAAQRREAKAGGVTDAG